MRYLFHDLSYKNRIIRYIRLPEIDSDGPQITTNIEGMLLLSQYIERHEPATIVIALLGRGIIGCSNEDKMRGPILQAFQKEYKRLPDAHYTWTAVEFVLD
ncbi:hypothetical protein FNT36_03310 [Hymenobacter setariae]|uniref:Uncharacterized protein n=1 Tax=Hymenobacter setariae TaxID=2594794 RepID=A0A558C2W3_9BACT|nr:hypothetical protein [Hymenobacter setariae]TVT43135.1 hypothetical protein FNT36_03310 [Hymenobacter setariae]